MDAKKDREKNAAYQRTYAKKHPERRWKSNQTYYNKNKEALAGKQKARRENKAPTAEAAALKEHRRSLGMSQQKYATALGVTQATLSMWERGAVPVNLKTVFKAFPELEEKYRNLGGNNDGK